MITALGPVDRSSASRPDLRVGPLLSVATRALLAAILAVLCFPAVLDRSFSALAAAGSVVVVTILITVSPHRNAATVHDRQLDHILAFGAAVSGAWVALTWSPADPVVAVVASGFTVIMFMFLLVGTRTSARLWPVFPAWFTAAGDLGALSVLVLALVAAVLVHRLLRRPRQFDLDEHRLGVPTPLKGVLPSVVAIAGAAALGWGLLR